MLPRNASSEHNWLIRNPDTALLRTFIAVVECGSLQAAANVVCRTQAVVSQQLKCLEKNVAIKLFQQNGRRLELTGRVLKSHDDMLILLHGHATGTGRTSSGM